MNKILFCILLVPFLSFAQEGFKPGKIDPELVKAKTCPIDSSAGAYYILDYGRTGINNQLVVELKHVVRLKILDKSELDRGDITIPYTTSMGVNRLRAFTYNYENGEVVTTKLEKSDIYKERVDENTTNMKFSMPNVKEGSVIEYSYTVNYGNYQSLNTWYFQTSIPVLRSEYEISIPEYFNYYRNMTGYIPLAKGTVNKVNGKFGDELILNNHHHYIALNVPAFDDEKYIRSRSDVISKIEFKLRSINVPGVIFENYLFNTYGGLAYKLADKDYWSKDIAKAKWAEDVLLTLQSDDKLEEATNIFNYIKEFEKAEESSLNLRSCFNEKKGTDIELNRMLIATLREAGFEVDPIMIRTRNLGKLDRRNPLRANLNFTIARVKIDDKTYLLDASEKEHVFGVLPRYCINGQGLVVKKGPEEWVDLKPYKANIQMIQSKLEMDEEGILTGSITIKKKGYDAWDFQEELKEDGEDQYIEDFEKAKENWSIESHTITTDDAYSMSEEIELEVEGQVEDLGSILYLNPQIYGGWEETPFKGTERIYPVHFGVPRTKLIITEITLPENITVETLPEAAKVGLPNNAGSITFSVSQVGNKLMINQRYKIKKLEYLPEEYPILREYFARIIEKSGEQIVLKRI